VVLESCAGWFMIRTCSLDNERYSDE
jgi:hypothetical protein